MKKMNKLTQTQNNLIDIMYDLSNQMNEAKDYTKIDADMNTLNDLSTIVKRLGDTVMLDISIENNREGEMNKC